MIIKHLLNVTNCRNESLAFEVPILARTTLNFEVTVGDVRNLRNL
jgi:hypothetical protein